MMKMFIGFIIGIFYTCTAFTVMSMKEDNRKAYSDNGKYLEDSWKKVKGTV